jgi:hypothetical protein
VFGGVAVRVVRAASFSVLLIVCVTACHPQTDVPGCEISGPEVLLPERVKQVRLGMTKNELEDVLGQADYSPVEGQYYFSTGGNCPLDEGDRVASCGVVAEFRDYSNDGVLTGSLQTCRWGAIGE